jgi:hypothetical protein
VNFGRRTVVMPHYIDRLTPAYDPWQGYEWPDRAGQLERAPRKKPPAD